MRQIIAVLMIAAALYGARRLFDYYADIQRRQNSDEPAAPAKAPGKPAPAPPEPLTGFRPGYEAALESSLAEAKRQGLPSMKAWLKQYRAYVVDPKLADIELDYVVLLGPSNRTEARQVLAGIRQRLPQDSPVYPRFKKLDEAYH